VKSLVAVAAAVLVTVPPLVTVPVHAQGTPQAASTPARPSDASLRRLLEVMEARKLVDGIPAQLDAAMSAAMQKQLQGQILNAEQTQILDAMRGKLQGLLQQELSWTVMEPIYLKVYGDTFSQTEINSMIGFYSSPAGHAVVQKLPLVLQNTMAVMQQRTMALMPTIQQMARETAEQIKAQHEAGDKNKAG